ncbi:histone acetyltransferase 1, partial [Ascosphaera atra]
CLSDPNVYELTVEDPNEDFDNLRDINDFRLIKPEFEKRGITININPYADLDPSAKRPPRRMPTSKLLSTTACTDLRTTLKLARNQFSHLLELYLLSQIPATHRGPRANMARLVMQKWRAKDENDRRYYWWRMLVKQRLYKKNKDVLMQAEAEERLDALDTTLGSVEEGYEEVLEALGAREAQLAREGEGIQRTGKRKVVSDSGDEDATEEEAKKRRSH